jgi:hypothetical protein
MSKKSGYIPAFNINTPHAGPQGPPLTVPPDQPVYSSYTSNLIGYGPIPWGTPTDAPIENVHYGKDFHVIEYVPANDSWMAHHADSSSIGMYHDNSSHTPYYGETSYCSSQNRSDDYSCGSSCSSCSGSHNASSNSSSNSSSNISLDFVEVVRDELEYQSQRVGELLSDSNDITMHSYYTILLKRHAKRVFKKDKLTANEMKYIDKIVTELETKNKLNKLKPLLEKTFTDQNTTITEILSKYDDKTVQWYYTKIFGEIVKQALGKNKLTFIEITFLNRLICQLLSEDKLNKTIASH